MSTGTRGGLGADDFGSRSSTAVSTHRVKQVDATGTWIVAAFVVGIWRVLKGAQPLPS
jgi:hypothetical protein